jgi:hypothetical protein
MSWTMIKTAVLAVITAVSLSLSAFSAQIGDVVEKNVSYPDRVTVPSGQPKAIAVIFLDDGVWDISGLVNLVVFNIPGGNLYTGATLAANVFGMSTNDGHTIINTTPVAVPTSTTAVGQAVPSRTVDINGDHKPVFLAAFEQISGGPARDGQAWGFISARKIRNNH